MQALKDRGLWPQENSQRPPEAPKTPVKKKVVPKALEVPQELVASYKFKDAAGKVIAVHERYEWGPVGEDGKRAKTFRWRLPDGTSNLGELREANLPLFGAELIAAAAPDTPIFVTEGEKAALACRQAGLLGICFAGGSSRTSFGEEIEQCRGRKVFLWPDNSADGRSFMARVHAVLRPIARAIISLHPPLPENGDAHEYFTGGGTVDALLAEAPPEEPVIEVLAHDGIKLLLPHPLGLLEWEARRITSARGEMKCELTLRTGPGQAWEQRINLLSANERNTLRTNLNEARGKDWGWADLINEACAKIGRAYTSLNRAKRAIEVPLVEKQEFLIPVFLPSSAPCVWFGSKASGKTFLALRAAIAVALGEKFLTHQAQTGAVLFLDYETSETIWRRRLNRLWRGMYSDTAESTLPDLPILYRHGRGIPLHEQVEALRRDIEISGITLVIVDSAAIACGGRPEEAETALRFFGALQALGEKVTALVLAHVTKAEDDRHPFGSIFFSNQPRRTFNVKRETEEEETSEFTTALFCRWVNEGWRPKPQAAHISFTDPDGPIQVDPSDIRESPELSRRRGLTARIADHLGSRGGLTAEQVASDLEEDLERVRDALRKSSRFCQKTLAGEPATGRGHKGIWFIKETRYTPPPELESGKLYD